MMMLIIKGDMVAAVLAASERKVKLSSISVHPKFRECIAYADSGAQRSVIAWYSEPGEAPFPDGALIFYSQTELPRE